MKIIEPQSYAKISDLLFLTVAKNDIDSSKSNQIVPFLDKFVLYRSSLSRNWSDQGVPDFGWSFRRQRYCDFYSYIEANHLFKFHSKLVAIRGRHASEVSIFNNVNMFHSNFYFHNFSPKTRRRMRSVEIFDSKKPDKGWRNSDRFSLPVS